MLIYLIRRLYVVILAKLKGVRMNIFYKLRTDKSIEKAVEDIKSNLKEQGFGTLFELNFKNKMVEKGFSINDNFIMLEVCNPSIASDILNQNIEVGYLLPCKVVVYEKEGLNYIGILNPTTLIDLVDKSFRNKAEGVEMTLKEIVQRSL